MDKFFAESAKRSKPAAAPLDSAKDGQDGQDVTGKKKFPRGVVLGKDGKPCRSCTSFADWAAMTASSTSSSASPPATTTATTTSSSLSSPLADCPPDVSTLGNHTWNLLHTITATYPPRASPTQQSEMRQFLHLFSKWYPCWVCAEDFQAWMQEKGNEPKVEGRERFGRWMCEAHNGVNKKLGKEVFDCNRWEERWRTGGSGC